ncbi:MAG: DUF3800 domain-containing protein [Chitinophagaceae bacterium]|nr:DUF3800 domain-containing protein [Chitinophagaceae bacterium]
MNYDVFVDESCHLEHDHASVMCIGYTKVPRPEYQDLRKQFIAVKDKYNVHSELKWQKFSKAKLDLYKSLVDFFMASPIEFRAVLVKYKGELRHDDFNMGSHDNFYYKMIFFLLKPNSNEADYRIFLDIKDTRGREKLRKIQEVFHNFYHGGSPFIRFQHLRSHDNEFFQLTDFFIGAITYKCRLLNKEVPENQAKQEFIAYLEKKVGSSLELTTPLWKTKFNVLDHQPKNL